ncbi:hypothetical protein [Micromonospora sp. WMMD737]|uniref:hypothetical protein n=1 Tax=Micromonospora sp. WMMD737 TaxID=3404113 RepID=UPI003B959908
MLKIPYKYRNKVHCRVVDKWYFDPIDSADLALTPDMGKSRRASSSEDTWRDLHVGLATAASLQASIRHADAKALALLTAEGSVAATAVDQALPATLDGNPTVAALTVLLTAVMAIAMTATTCQLALSLWPRLAGAGGANRFGFPDLVALGSRPSIAPASRHRNEAWGLRGSARPHRDGEASAYSAVFALVSDVAGRSRQLGDSRGLSGRDHLTDYCGV